MEHFEVLQFVEKNQRATVIEIGEYFAVSVATVRRDLEALQNEGLIERIYGGARRLKQPVVRAMIKDELQIDELIDDWLYKKLMKKKSMLISEDYFNRKIYSIPSF